MPFTVYHPQTAAPARILNACSMPELRADRTTRAFKMQA